MKTPYKKFMAKCIGNCICALLSVVMAFMQKTPLWLVFGAIFVWLAMTNYSFAKKHKDDAKYLWAQITDKIKEKRKEEKRMEKEEKKEMKQKYQSRLDEIKADFDFDYGDEEE